MGAKRAQCAVGDGPLRGQEEEVDTMDDLVRNARALHAGLVNYVCECDDPDLRQHLRYLRDGAYDLLESLVSIRDHLRA